MYLWGPGKHNCQPFCGPEGRFYCSDSVCSLWPAPFSYLCVSVMILCVCWKLSAAEQVKTDCCHTPAVVSTLLTPLPVSCPLTTPHHNIYIYYRSMTKAVHVSRFGLAVRRSTPFRSPFSLKSVVCGYCLVTLVPHSYETLKRLSSVAAHLS